MIYYIVKIERNGNETVLNSFDNADKATKFLEGYRLNVASLGDIDTAYRIDTVPSNEEKTGQDGKTLMIYYIVHITKNGDETVMSSHDNADAATKAIENYRDEYVGRFRIDTVPSNEEKRAANAAIPADPNPTKAALNRQFGKNKMEHEEQHYAYRDTDSLHVIQTRIQGETGSQSHYGRYENGVWIPLETGETRDFTREELFGPTCSCGECGARVKPSFQGLHTTWHNKLLP